MVSVALFSAGCANRPALAGPATCYTHEITRVAAEHFRSLLTEENEPKSLARLLLASNGWTRMSAGKRSDKHGKVLLSLGRCRQLSAMRTGRGRRYKRCRQAVSTRFRGQGWSGSSPCAHCAHACAFLLTAEIARGCTGLRSYPAPLPAPRSRANFLLSIAWFMWLLHSCRVASAR